MGPSPPCAPGSWRWPPASRREFWGLFALPDAARTLKVKIADFRDLQVPVQ
ncbi:MULTISPECIES: hypothetical protein [Nonomuraea]|uniref:Uncharacterized protein n=1 Tax=Nonomuraea mangrovi TaxID=2316207 RepID=A0ABW4SVC4_9ACTN